MIMYWPLYKMSFFQADLPDIIIYQSVEGHRSTMHLCGLIWSLCVCVCVCLTSDLG